MNASHLSCCGGGNGGGGDGGGGGGGIGRDMWTSGSGNPWTLPLYWATLEYSNYAFYISRLTQVRSYIYSGIIYIYIYR
jgi:hypothetical protein